MTDAQLDAVAITLAADPTAGDLMQDTGGGYRITPFYGGLDLPVFLLTVFGKGEKANLTRAECNALAVLAKTLVESYRKTGEGRER